MLSKRQNSPGRAGARQTMNITVLAVGNKMPGWVNEAVKEYAKRFV